jgi:hypothetical protein
MMRLLLSVIRVGSSVGSLKDIVVPATFGLLATCRSQVVEYYNVDTVGCAAGFGSYSNVVLRSGMPRIAG